jgi:uncharacterized protein YhbP (UPF0306 family)
MSIERSQRRISARRIAEVAHELLDASTLCAIATVDPNGRAHINTAYFAWSPSFEIVWISEPRAKHSRNIHINGTAAVSVFDSSQSWGQPDRGIQLFGIAHKAEGHAADDVVAIYAGRFSAVVESDLPAYHPYLFRPRRLKVFHERALGGGVFVTATVDRAGKLSWNRTEIYDAKRSP